MQRFGRPFALFPFSAAREHAAPLILVVIIQRKYGTEIVDFLSTMCSIGLAMTIVNSD